MKNTTLEYLTKKFLSEMDNALLNDFQETMYAAHWHLFVRIKTSQKADKSWMLYRLYFSHKQLCDHLKLPTLLQSAVSNPDFDECQNKYYQDGNSHIYQEEPQLSQLITKMLRNFDFVFFTDYCFTEPCVRSWSNIFEGVEREDPCNDHDGLGKLYLSYVSLCDYLKTKPCLYLYHDIWDLDEERLEDERSNKSKLPTIFEMFSSGSYAATGVVNPLNYHKDTKPKKYK